jgi:hypothetical protein
MSHSWGWSRPARNFSRLSRNPCHLLQATPEDGHRLRGLGSLPLGGDVHGRRVLAESRASPLLPVLNFFQITNACKRIAAIIARGEVNLVGHPAKLIDALGMRHGLEQHQVFMAEHFSRCPQSVAVAAAVSSR